MSTTIIRLPRSSRQYVGKLVPSNPSALLFAMLGIAIVNEATLGYDSSMMNGLNILPQYTEYFSLTTATIGLNNAATWMGAIIACFFLQPVPDRWGRKFGILAGSIVCLFGVVLQSASQNITMFVVGRIFIGIGSGLTVGSAPTLISEVVPPRFRGAIMGLFFSCFYVGSLLSAAVNYRCVDIMGTWSWRVPSIIQGLFSILAVMSLPLTPESPRWYISKGKEAEARETLAVIYGHFDPNGEETSKLYNEITNIIAKEDKLYPGNPWKEFISSKSNLHRLFIVSTFGIMTEMSGNFVISYYLGAMLTQAGITNPVTQLQINIILSCWSLLAAVCGSLLFDTFGRRKQTIACYIGMISTLYIFGGLAKVYGTGSSNNSGIYGTIAVLFLFQGFYAFSISPLSSLYPSEVTNLKTRTAGVAVYKFFNSSFGLIASFSMSYAMENLGWKFYFINASWNIGFLAIMYFTWVETARVPLEEIAAKFGDIHPDELIDSISVDTPELTSVSVNGKGIEK